MKSHIVRLTLFLTRIKNISILTLTKILKLFADGFANISTIKRDVKNFYSVLSE
jgi:hypothetical protein